AARQPVRADVRLPVDRGPRRPRGGLGPQRVHVVDVGGAADLHGLLGRRLEQGVFAQARERHAEAGGEPARGETGPAEPERAGGGDALVPQRGAGRVRHAAAGGDLLAQRGERVGGGFRVGGGGHRHGREQRRGGRGG